MLCRHSKHCKILASFIKDLFENFIKEDGVIPRSEGFITGMSIFQPKSNEDAISLCFQDAIKKLDEVDADANEKKTKIVQDLAKDLVGKISTDRISIEIVHRLHGKGVSESLIRNSLDEKYKQKHRVENARKRKKKTQVTVLATPLLLEQDKRSQQIAVTQDGKSVTIDEAPATNQMNSVVEQTPFPF